MECPGPSLGDYRCLEGLSIKLKLSSIIDSYLPSPFMKPCLPCLAHIPAIPTPISYKSSHDSVSVGPSDLIVMAHCWSSIARISQENVFSFGVYTDLIA